ncbi:MAG: SH3 domain-containing protein [Lachnospiraceae bacterium]
MQKGMRKVLSILGIILVISVIGFACKDPIVNTLFYNMDEEMDLPKDLKSDPKYAPGSSSKKNKENKENKENKVGEIYTVKVETGVLLRSWADENADSITKLEYGTQVILIDDSTSLFVKVKLADNPDIKGYLKRDYLKKK